MQAGTIGIFDAPADEPLADHYDDGDGLPALAVDRTQAGLDDGAGPVQSGSAAAHVEATAREASVAHGRDGEPGGIMVEQVVTSETAVADWVADPTGSGLVVASSLAGDESAPFPFDLLGDVADRRVVRQAVDVRALHTDWTRDDALVDVWMVGSERGTEDNPATSIAYHDAADADVEPTIGLGFEHERLGGGVVYASGYVALYDVESASTFARFVADEVLPYCAPVEDTDVLGEQATLDERENGAGGDDDGE